MASVQKPRLVCQSPTPGAIIPHFLPRYGLTMLAGAPNIGKTAFLATLLRDIRDGRSVFGHAVTAPPAIGVINADRGWDEGAGLWFARAGYPDIHHYSLSDDPDFNPKRFRRKFDRTDLFASLVDSLKLPPDSLVEVDPLSAFLGGNLLDYDACMVACLEIRAYLRERRYTLLGTAHTAKLKADKRERYMRLTDQMFGSTAISGFTDSALYLASPEELGKSYYALVWHPHGAKKEQHCLDRDEQGLFIPWVGADGETLNRVVSLFPDDGTTLAFKDLVERAESLPLSRRTVKNSLDTLLEQGRIERIRHGEYRRVVLQ